MSATLASCPRCQSLIQVGAEACCPNCGAELIRPAEAADTSFWYYAANKEKKGPISWTELSRLVQAGAVSPADMVLPVGGRQWQPARNVPGLADTNADSFPPLAEVPLAEASFVSLLQPPARESLPPTSDRTASGSGSITDDFLGQVGLPTVPGYEILAELGRGGMGVVYKARHLQLKRVVALKMILAGDYAGGQARARFRAEAETVARLQHPNIVQLYEIGEHDDKPYFSLEYVSGGSLGDHVDGPQPPRQAADLIRILAQGMQAAHAVGIIHRDLKPGNILLQPASGSSADGALSSAWGIPKIGDFGLAKQLDGEHRTQTGDVLGTPQYMAPEQALGQIKQIGPGADIYALGTILYELLTGRAPFQGESAMDTLLLVTSTEPVPPRRLQPKVPADLETICLKCLEKQPAQRYPSSAALADDLQRFLGDQPIVARPVGWVERTTKWARRRPAIASLLAAVMLVGLLGLGGILWQWRKAEVARTDAVEQRGLAEEEAARAKAALADTERTHYFHRVALAHREWQFRHVGRARVLLDECPPARRDWEWRYLRRLFNPELATIHRPGEDLMHVAFSPDGRYVASASWQATATIYDADSRKELAVCRGHTGPVWRVAFSPDGKLLASGGKDKTVRLWQVPSGKLVRVLGEHRNTVQGLSFHPEGTKLVSAGGDIKAWDLASGKVLTHINPPKGDYQKVVYHPNGEQLAAVGHHTTIHIWEVKTGKPTSWQPSHERAIYGLAYSPDGKWLATCSADRTVELHDAASGKRAYLLRGASEMVSDVAFSPDSQRLAGACSDETVLVWELTPRPPVVILRGHTGPTHGVAFARDGRLASAGADGAIRFWDSRVDPEAQILHHDQERDVDGAAFSPDRRFIAFISGPTVRVWDRQTQAVVRQLTSAELSYADALALSPDSRYVAAGGKCYDDKKPPGVVVVWELASGKPVQLFRMMDRNVTCLTFGPDGTLYAGNGPALFYDDEVKKHLPIAGWNVTTGKQTITLPGNLGGAAALAVSPDGKYLVAGGADRMVRLWDLRTAKELVAFAGHQGEVTGLVFQPGGQLMASSSRDRTIKLWDMSTGQVVRTLQGHNDYVGTIAFTPDGRRLASGGGDGGVKIWDTATGQDVLTLSRHYGAVNTVAFSPDGRFLASGSVDQTLLLWHAPE